MKSKLYLFLLIALSISLNLSYGKTKSSQRQSGIDKPVTNGFVNAAGFGFSPNASGIENTEALQRAVDQGGTIIVSQPGTYKLAGTVYIGSNTSLIFGNNIFIKKVDEKGTFSHVILNKGALTKTYDDAVALNAHDYSVGNPELGWIEDGVVENCHDLNDDKKPVGYFCRILAGAWIDWRPGMEVQQSDAVVSNGRIYRVQAYPDGKIYKSNTRPTHEKGSMMLDGINWGVVQTDVTYTAGVRNVVFRDIFLEKPRTGFSVHFDNDKFSRSYYPGAEIPKQEQLTFDNIRVLHDQPTVLFSIGTPVDVLTITNSSFRDNRILFHGNKAMPDYLKTKINIIGCVFNKKGAMDLLTNSVENKEIFLKTSSNIELFDNFSARVIPGNGKIVVESDLTGLKK